MDFVEDLAPFFSGFATDATLDGEDVRGILDTSYHDALGNLVEGYAPIFTLPTADAGVSHGVDLVVNGATYKVVGVEPDGTGITVLRLERQ
jgi:hypothetical protein